VLCGGGFWGVEGAGAPPVPLGVDDPAAPSCAGCVFLFSSPSRRFGPPFAGFAFFFLVVSPFSPSAA